MEAFCVASTPPNKLEQRTIYYHVICHLPGHILELIADRLDPTEETPYSNVIEAVSNRVIPSKTCQKALGAEIRISGDMFETDVGFTQYTEPFRLKELIRNFPRNTRFYERR